ncbi:hypothetical protein LEP1GSC018_2472 [Leptospira kirschneri str. 2008720114]|nr:hypothetical protein LEP1GSC018_2472 [Leptospira kirschneri str. 2008720114]
MEFFNNSILNFYYKALFQCKILGTYLIVPSIKSKNKESILL